VNPKLKPALAPLFQVALTLLDENQLITGSANTPKLIFCAKILPGRERSIIISKIEILLNIPKSNLFI
jgi:hypothetical protein